MQQFLFLSFSQIPLSNKIELYPFELGSKLTYKGSVNKLVLTLIEDNQFEGLIVTPY